MCNWNYCNNQRHLHKGTTLIHILTLCCLHLVDAFCSYYCAQDGLDILVHDCMTLVLFLLPSSSANLIPYFYTCGGHHKITTSTSCRCGHHECNWGIYTSCWNRKHHQRKLQNVHTIFAQVRAGCSKFVAATQAKFGERPCVLVAASCFYLCPKWSWLSATCYI